ncbi:hypothetical protein [Cumulibacter manganitolerans]|uniref:hypothetical protein n=1 Tax=Cumulibacter manganitolerans TaxID=1884992 RepID=UPI001297C73C|nr:hypothetical protein [Cumulibacter manganitolerans]
MGGDGPRTQQVNRDVATWMATLERLDQAEERAAAARQAVDQAAELSTRLEQLEAHTPRRREREQWAHAVAAARAEREEAQQRAQEIAAQADRTAAGLPEAQHWPQMRAHASAGLHDAPARRERAVTEDRAERESAAYSIPDLTQQIETLQQQRNDLRMELELRTDDYGTVSTSPTHVNEPDSRRYEIAQDRHRERD